MPNSTNRTSAASMADFEEKVRRQDALAAQLLANDPSLGITAYIMAGDLLSQEQGDAALAQGAPFWNAAIHVGSYGRFEWAVRALDRGAVDPATFYEALPELWRGSDPDDTDARFLQVWRDAKAANGGKPVFDEKPLPRRKWLQVFRGQDEGAAVGFAWSLDRDIATKFAMGAGLRQSSRNGTILRGVVRAQDVLGYLTGRGESEVVVDPQDVTFGLGTEEAQS